MKKKHGFSIIELLVAVSLFTVIMLIASIAMVEIIRSSRRNAIQRQVNQEAKNVLETIGRTGRLASGSKGGEAPIVVTGGRLELRESNLSKKEFYINGDTLMMDKVNYSELPGSATRDDLDIVLVVDGSGSMNDDCAVDTGGGPCPAGSYKIDFLRNAGAEFINNLAAVPGPTFDRIAVNVVGKYAGYNSSGGITYSYIWRAKNIVGAQETISGGTITMPDPSLMWETDRAVVASEIASLDATAGCTNIGWGIRLGNAQFASIPVDPARKRVMIVLSDGASNVALPTYNDIHQGEPPEAPGPHCKYSVDYYTPEDPANLATKSVRDAAEEARAMGITVYSIAFGTTELDLSTLTTITDPDHTDGFMVHALQGVNLKEKFDEILAALIGEPTYQETGRNAYEVTTVDVDASQFNLTSNESGPHPYFKLNTEIKSNGYDNPATRAWDKSKVFLETVISSRDYTP